MCVPVRNEGIAEATQTQGNYASKRYSSDEGEAVSLKKILDSSMTQETTVSTGVVQLLQESL
jgi:hypothetical protein